jgi:S1-C subfamily serine protease
MIWLKDIQGSLIGDKSMRIQNKPVLLLQPTKSKRQLGMFLAAALMPLTAVPTMNIRPAHAETGSTGTMYTETAAAKQIRLDDLAKSDPRWAKAIGAMQKGVDPFSVLTDEEIRGMACGDNGERPADPKTNGAASMAQYLKLRTLRFSVSDNTPIKEGESPQAAFRRLVGGEGLGSGSVCRIMPDGTVFALSANHVPTLDGAYQGHKLDTSVTLPDGNTVDAQVLASDQRSDNVVITFKLPSGANLKPLPITTKPPALGDSVWTLGDPLGMPGTFVGGLISRPERYRHSGTPQAPIYTSKVQVTAPIAPGNSGGGIVNDEGALIGTNDSILAAQGSSGQPLAIPGSIAFANDANSVAATAVAAQLGLPTQTHMTLGVSFTPVQLQHLPRRIATLQGKADILEKAIDGVNAQIDAANKSKTVPKGFTLPEQEIPPELAAIFGQMMGPNAQMPASKQANKPVTLADYLKYLTTQSEGYQKALAPLTAEIANFSQDLESAKANPLNAKTNGFIVHGVVPKSLAEKAGLKPGDIITAFDGKSVIDPSVELDKALALVGNHYDWQQMTITYQRNAQEYTVTANPDGFKKLLATLK